MTGVAMPDEDRLPPGPQRELTAAIHELYAAAGKPGTRRISNAIRDRDDLPDTVSHEAVRAILGGTRSRWHKVESLVRQLAAWSTGRPQVDATVREIHQLWLAVDGVGAAEPRIEPADTAVLRQAVRGLHGPTAVDAIDAFLRTELYVPLTATRAFVVAATPTRGLWLCVYTSLDRLRRHQSSIRPSAADGWAAIVGAELVRRVRNVELPIGILVDPAGADGADCAETLPLPDQLVTEIANSLTPTLMDELGRDTLP
jgi:hypothetical protein